MPHEADELETNTSKNESLADVLARGLSRRTFLRGALSVGALQVLGACSGDDDPGPMPPPTDPPTTTPPARPDALGFEAVPKSLLDQVSVPAGYSVTVLYRLGDPIASGVPAYGNLGTDAAITFDRRAGDHHDGMHFFGLGAGNGHDPGSAARGLLVLNHEAITPLFLHPNGQTIVNGARTVAEEVLREFFAHGVSIVEVIRDAGGRWTYAVNGAFNRRIHTLTEIELAGPLRGHPAMVTRFSPSGERTRGTVNDCANGHTPWGTYLACEENWAGYFRRVKSVDDPNRSAKELTALARDGI
ncbi:MAG TPA: alkaline phosphatase PhoX, partial [Anaeromyxobacteraceae bacterium]|nr:alkaline phosphatase PhoX [Anaeromyxobacteraceae bacterium]